ncbi:hypothetical protein [Almyronema epifaneia]|uniref:DUF4124 domain-containing protein n=1 Tax=Almyronema epifaneia S1 TaxID=2991925 RepID=A0ABW6IK77_9CYAN
MKLNLWVSLGSISAIAAILSWQAAGRAENVCYMIDATGREINLNQLCQNRNPLTSPPSLEAGNASETTPAANTPSVRGYTIIREVEPAAEAATPDGEETALPDSGLPAEALPADTDPAANNTLEENEAALDAAPSRAGEASPPADDFSTPIERQELPTRRTADENDTLDNNDVPTDMSSDDMNDNRPDL